MFPLACPTTCVPGWSLGYQPSLRWGLPILHEAGLGIVCLGGKNPQALHDFTVFFFLANRKMLDSWRCFFWGFFGKPINFPVDLYGGLRGKKPGLSRGSYSGSSGVGERFWLLLHPDKSEHLLAKVPQFWKRPKKQATLFSNTEQVWVHQLKTKVALRKGKSFRAFRNHQFGEFHAEGWKRSSAGRIPSEEDGWESAVSGPCGFHQLAWSRRLTVGW